MPSVGTFKAQPTTHSFVVTQDNNNGEAGPWTFTQANIDTWLSTNAGALTVVGSLITIPAANFIDVLYTGANDLPTSGTYDQRKTLLDLGKQYVIGNDINSRLVVLRLVLFPNDSTVGGLGGNARYVVIENNCTDLAPSDYGRFSVRVARI